MPESTTGSRVLDRAGRVLAILSFAALTGCVAQAGPVAGPSPADASSSSGEAAVTAEAEAQAEPIRDLEVRPEDPVEVPLPESARDRPTPEEIDRAIRQSLGDDPIGLIRSADVGRSHLPLVVNDRVEAWINYFQTVIPERFGLYLERKARYEAMIRRELREADMPQDLIYLALIESGMNPRAYSRARAVGMWQFIASTGRAYDLEVSFWIDERRDPDKATRAALRYLSDLYDEFGSWYLAAAAYNGGPGRIRRGLRRVDGGSFWDLADARLLRSETTNYVPKLIAAAVIGHDPARYGFDWLEHQSEVEVETVIVPEATSFDVLAEVAGTDEETIRELNPQYPQRVTPPGRAVEVRIPVEGAAEFETRYAAVPADERVTWTYHVVARGQTLGQIAQRYGVTVSALRAANGNVNPRRLQIGQRLVVPNPARMASSTASRATTAGSTQRLETQSGPVTVVVERGDSLWSIARRFSVSTRQIMDWNSLSSTTIRPGDRLQIKP